MSQQSVPARRHRRVVALSALDRQRVERGESLMPEQRLDALTARQGDALPEYGAAESDAAWGDESSRGESANDARLLRNVPPHW